MNWLGKIIQKEITKDDTVLDLGCGMGRVSEMLVPYGVDLVAVDINYAAVRSAKLNPRLSDVQFSVQSGPALAFKNNSFDK